MYLCNIALSCSTIVLNEYHAPPQGRRLRYYIDKTMVLPLMPKYGGFRSKTVFFNSPSITGKSESEALIFESVNPQYDDRLLIESPQKYKFRTCTNIALNVKIKTKRQFLYTACSELVFFGGIQ